MTDCHPLNGLLLEDLKYFGGSLWRNDKIGEKRYNFFLTLVTAAIAGLVTLHTKSSAEAELKNLPLLTQAALWSLFGIGVLTYLRLLLRNRVAEEYRKTLDYIRKQLVKINSDARFENYEVPDKANTSPWALKGGLAGTVGALNAALLGAALYQQIAIYSEIAIWCAGFSGVLFFVLSWAIAVIYRK
jgi:hypothetical protein